LSPDQEHVYGCEAFGERLLLLFDENVMGAEREKITAHLDSCDSCRAAYEDVQWDNAALARVRSRFEELSAERRKRLEKRFEAAVKTFELRRRRTSWRIHRRWFARAAIVVLTLSTLGLLTLLQDDAEEAVRLRLAVKRRGARSETRGPETNVQLELELSAPRYVYIVQLDHRLSVAFYFPYPQPENSENPWYFGGHDGNYFSEEHLIYIPRSRDDRPMPIRGPAGTIHTFFAFASETELSPADRQSLLAEIKEIVGAAQEQRLSYDRIAGHIETWLKSRYPGAVRTPIPIQ
jgi:hypothetical protein